MFEWFTQCKGFDGSFPFFSALEGLTKIGPSYGGLFGFQAISGKNHGKHHVVRRKKSGKEEQK